MAQTQPISVENFAHVCIGVSDMDKSVSFYAGVLGTDVGTRSSASSSHLSAQDTRFRR
jgi:catechol 2,3-dioxygenase-like lactoylglutathione lyase family enzyme